MLPRTLEPEVMDTVEEAEDYNAMDHSAVNRVFAGDLMAACQNRPEFALNPGPPQIVHVLDVGTGTALIPIELCQQWQYYEMDNWRVMAIDLAEEMLKLARKNVDRAGLTDRISLQRVDSKALPFDDGAFDVVMSNSIIHHIPEPIDCMKEMWRVLKPRGMLFVRDLYRPESSEVVESLVNQYAGSESLRQQQLFRQSFHAALTIEEVRSLADACGLTRFNCRMTSDRHWTLTCVKP
jgi:ubiquinone/menaquinone biosynthesis C-methylase UbiE